MKLNYVTLVISSSSDQNISEIAQNFNYSNKKTKNNMTNDDHNNIPSSTSKISSVKNSSSSNLQSYFEKSGDQRTPSNISLKEVVFFTGNTAVDQTITHGILHLYRSKKSYGFRDRIEYDEDDDEEVEESIGMDELGLIDSEMILLYWWGLKIF